MAITAKELAKKLNLSEAAISMALNNKPGVSTETRNHVIEMAHTYGYDFTKIKRQTNTTGTINFIIYRKHGAIISDSPFFSTLTDSVEKNCREQGYRIAIQHIYDGSDVKEQLDTILAADCVGIILLGTEMGPEDFFPFAYVNVPVVVLDTYFESIKMDCVLINNVQGAMQATQHLIKRYNTQPGYLHSSYSIHNFTERADGFYKSLRSHGLSTSRTIVHSLSPSLEGAHADMLAILESGEPLARAYFADNDLIAAGAMNAFKEKGYRIPEDIAIVGFDNMPFCSYMSPPLTSINAATNYTGQIAVQRLVYVLNSKHFHPIKIEISTNLVKRKSS